MHKRPKIIGFPLLVYLYGGYIIITSIQSYFDAIAILWAILIGLYLSEWIDYFVSKSVDRKIKKMRMDK